MSPLGTHRFVGRGSSGGKGDAIYHWHRTRNFAPLRPNGAASFEPYGSTGRCGPPTAVELAWPLAGFLASAHNGGQAAEYAGSPAVVPVGGVFRG